jgi:hypothetical protein
MCKKEKGNKSGQLETIKCLKFIHMRDRMILNAGNGKFIWGFTLHGFSYVWLLIN